MKRQLVFLCDCIFLLRPPLLVPVWTVLALGWLTAGPGRVVGGCLNPQGGECPGARFWVILVAFSSLVASIYVVNQIADIEGDRLNNKLFLLPRRIIPVAVAWAIAAGFLTAGMVAALRFGMVLFLLFVCSAVLGMLYNLPPFSLKDRPLGGVVANLIGHGVLTYLVGWFSATGNLGPDAFVSSLSPGFANAAVYLVSTIADCRGDASTGKKTFCVRYGERATAVFALLCCLASLGLALVIPFNGWLMWVTAAVSVVFFAQVVQNPQREVIFRAFKCPVFILAVLIAALMPSYALLTAVVFVLSRWYYRRRFSMVYPGFGSS